ncbi:TPA: hypothetical protein I8372_001464 [Citrobacter farmeri]|nr:hypothetical protein [Citrobacter farmeri]HAT2776360.1 hypothetical protein [Citrobacter farmeri]HAT2807325.1 hypothetical protein [Citrobacter farmeri]HBC0547141.1 hypothetical protein [Citrobacter farmeri]
MKAKFYSVSKNGHDLIASTIENTNDFVTTYTQPRDYFSPILDQGYVTYTPKPGTITNIINNDTLTSNITDSKNDVGKVKKHVWRPGLNCYIEQALNITPEEFNRSKRELRILIEKLKDILLYIEPCDNSMASYGHKLRELLILTCTAIESYWLSYLKFAAPNIQRPRTNDYVKLKDVLLLNTYKVNFINHPYLLEFKPFGNWDEERPTQTLSWYDDYNKTKHDSLLNFDKANLKNCIQAIGALIVMQCVRFSPLKVLSGQEITAQLINEHFIISLDNPPLEEFYIPNIESHETATGAFSAPLASIIHEWEVEMWSLEP